MKETEKKKNKKKNIMIILTYCPTLMFLRVEIHNINVDINVDFCFCVEFLSPTFTAPNLNPTTTIVETPNSNFTSTTSTVEMTSLVQDDFLNSIAMLAEEVQNSPQGHDSSSSVHISEETVEQSNSLQDSFERAISDCIKKCKVEKITDPIEILRCASAHIVQGRPLDISSASETVEGETNFIHLDREDILKSAFEEISSVFRKSTTYFGNLVRFYGELASDLGGPRREFFMLCLIELQSKYFDNGLRDYMSNDYEIVGLIIGLSMLQNGRVPHFD